MTIETHISREGEWEWSGFKAHGWTSGDNRANSWTYWWIEIEAGTVTGAEYEILREGTVVVRRARLLKSPKLFARTGFEDEEPDDPPGFGPIGGAAKLEAGIYSVDFYLTIGNASHLLRGVRFEVADRQAEEGGWQITTPLPGESHEG